MTGAAPWLLMGGIVGGALMYYYTIGQAEGAEPEPAEPKPEPKPIPKPAPESKLPTDKAPVLPDNVVIVQSAAEWDFKVNLALQMGLQREGLVMAIYRSPLDGIVLTEAALVATANPQAVFLFYPEVVSAPVNPVEGKVSFSCGPNDLAVVNAFPTVLTVNGPRFGEQPTAAPWCVTTTNAAELRAALATAADTVV